MAENNSLPNAGLTHTPPEAEPTARPQPEPLKRAGKKRRFRQWVRARIYPNNSLNKRILFVPVLAAVVLFAVLWQSGDGPQRRRILPERTAKGDKRAGEKRGAAAVQTPSGGEVYAATRPAAVPTEAPSETSEAAEEDGPTARHDRRTSKRHDDERSERATRNASAERRIEKPEPPRLESFVVLLRAGGAEDGERIRGKRIALDQSADDGGEPRGRAAVGESASSSAPPAIPPGTRIPLELVDPVASGLSRIIRARVTKDIPLSDGRVIARGSAVYLPVDESSGPGVDGKQGRIVYDATDEDKRQGRLFLGAVEIQIDGDIRGEDGFPGLPGRRVKTSGGEGWLKRAGRTVAGTASRSLRGSSPIRLQELEREIFGHSRSANTREQFITIVEKGTRFEFVVGM